MKWIYRLYIFFLGVILTITTGFGVAAFYPEPVMPQYPTTPYAPPVPVSCNNTPEQQASQSCQAALEKQQQVTESQNNLQRAYEQNLKSSQEKNAGYTRTAIFFGVVVGALFAIGGIMLIKKSRLIANGLLFAGLLTAVFTRLIISLASLGQAVIGTSNADSLSVIEFVVLAILSGAIIGVGLVTLKEKV